MTKKDVVYKDAAKRILRVGDTVAFVVPNYRTMALGKIVKFTPKMVTIEYGKENINRFRDEVCRVDYKPEDLGSILKG
jgi:aspartate 1-decarboxylase